MKSTPHSSEPSRYPVKTIIRVVAVAAVGAVIYSAVFAPPGPATNGTSNPALVGSARAAVQPESWWPAPSSTATEGNVVDLTFPQF